MTDLDEDDIEQNLINPLKNQGYDDFQASDLERDAFDRVTKMDSQGYISAQGHGIGDYYENKR